jgi:hypothetical protein
VARHRLGRDGHVRLRIEVLLDDAGEVDAVELVAGENHHEVRLLVDEVVEARAHGVGGALVPALGVGRLLRREDAHEAAVEVVEVDTSTARARAAKRC